MAEPSATIPSSLGHHGPYKPDDYTGYFKYSLDSLDSLGVSATPLGMLSTLGEALESVGDEGTDYRLSEDHGSCWVEVDGLAIYIVRGAATLDIEVYPAGREMDQELATIQVPFKKGNRDGEVKNGAGADTL